MALVELIAGAAIGTAFTALYEGVKKVIGKTTKFNTELEDLQWTLECFDPQVIQKIGRHNQALGLPNVDVEALELELRNGAIIISELTNPHLWNRTDYRQRKQLVQLNRTIKALNKKVQMQAVRVGMETCHMVGLFCLRLTLQEEPGRDGRLLDMLLTLDPIRNIASTSTLLPQIHTNGEIQGVGRSSGHLISSPLVNSTTSSNGQYLEVQMIAMKMGPASIFGCRSFCRVANSRTPCRRAIFDECHSEPVHPLGQMSNVKCYWVTGSLGQ